MSLLAKLSNDINTSYCVRAEVESNIRALFDSYNIASLKCITPNCTKQFPANQSSLYFGINRKAANKSYAALCDSISDALINFEPRLCDIDITILNKSDSIPPIISLRIQGLLKINDENRSSKINVLVQYKQNL